jgi:hypothetical protein
MNYDKLPSDALENILFESARDSVRFALTCLEPVDGRLRAISSFVNTQAEIMHWHDFGDLEGPGWAANALGGAHLLYRWGAFTGDAAVQDQAVLLVEHVLEDGFIDFQSGFIRPYYELAKKCFCLNYRHNDDWLCPGSLAKIGVQLLAFADDLPASERPGRMARAALGLGRWLRDHTPLLPNGWVPRRITRDGQPYPLSPEGRPDPIFDHSADGLYLLQLWAALAARGQAEFAAPADGLGRAFTGAGGLWGSINHDTYDSHESVAYSAAFLALRQAAGWLNRPEWRDFAYRSALPALARFQMREDRNGVETRGLLWMEESWDTAYLWENAEAAQAYLEAWAETGDQVYRDSGLDILLAIARHHHGPLGFLTEGVDWNNHVGQQHHVDSALYGDIQYTEPLLNNLHLVGPTLFYFEKASAEPKMKRAGA